MWSYRNYLNIIFTCLCSTFCFAQTDIDVTCKFEHSAVNATINSTFSNRLFINNHSGEAFTFRLKPLSSTLVPALIALPKDFTLHPGEKLTLPVKYMTNTKTLSSNQQKFNYVYSVSDGAKTINVNIDFSVLINETDAISISTTFDELQLKTGNSLIQAFVEINNTGIIARNIRLEGTVNPANAFKVLTSPKVKIAAGSSETVPVTLKRIGNAASYDCELQLAAVDDTDNKLLTVKMLRIITPGSVKRFAGTPGSLSRHNEDFIALSYLNYSGDISMVQFRGAGRHYTGQHSKFTYRANVDYYNERGGVNMYDTYIGWENDKVSLRAGNIYQNLDYPLNISGGEVSYRFNNGKRLSLFGGTNNYMLFNFQDNAFQSEVVGGGKLLWHEDTKLASTISAFYTKSRQFNTHTFQTNAEKKFTLGKNGLAAVEGAFSVVTPKNASGREGFALGGSLSKEYSVLNFSANMFYGSPYYSGLRKGSLLAEGNMQLKAGDKSFVSARFMLLDVKPRYINTMYLAFVESQNRMQRYELSWQNYQGALSYSVRPYYMTQAYKLDNRSWSVNSIRMANDVNIRWGKSSVVLNSDVGYSYKAKGANLGDKYFSAKFNINYNNAIWGLSGFMQFNPYYISDASVAEQGSRYRIYSVGPNANFSWFKDKLQGQIRLLYNFYEYNNTDNVTANGAFRWRQTGGWALVGEILASRFDNRSYESGTEFLNRQFRIGVEKRFAGNEKGGRKLKLNFYADENNNEAWDRGEQAVQDLLVKIGDASATTDKKGTVTFLNMTETEYAVTLVSERQWSTKFLSSVLMNKNKEINVPLVKTAMLTGTILPEKIKYLAADKPLAGIRVYAVNSEGKKFSTLSDADGIYSFYLAPGSYKIIIPTEGLPFTVKEPSKFLTIENTREKLYKLNFEYHLTDTHIEVKRF